jgi:hypothetical protein
MSSYKKEIQDFLPADELHGNDAVVIDQPDVLHGVTEKPGVTRKATATQFAEFMAGSAEVAAVVAEAVAEASGALQSLIGQESETRAIADAALRAQIDLGHGRGGALTAHDFETAAPTQAQLIEYACTDIWGGGGTFTFDAGHPEESTYQIGEPDNGITHTASEIFNNTWVRNTYNGENHKWVLTNTQDTDPAVYVWTDVGQDVVMGATDTYAGVAKLYNGYAEANTDGSVTQAAVYGLNSALSTAIAAKLNSAGGTLTGMLSAMPTPTTAAQVRNISIGPTPLIPGESALATGEVYLCYE